MSEAGKDMLPRVPAQGAMEAGWEACRQSVYALCEHVDAEAAGYRALKSQHAQGYAAGMAHAAKLISRGFCAMDAKDDNNLVAAAASAAEDELDRLHHKANADYIAAEQRGDTIAQELHAAAASWLGNERERSSGNRRAALSADPGVGVAAARKEAAEEMRDRAAAPDGWQLVPIEPTEAMWGELARQIVMWSRFTNPTGKALHNHLRHSGYARPDWLLALIPYVDHVPPKGDVAVAIYRAMLGAAPPLPSSPDHEKATATPTISDPDGEARS